MGRSIASGTISFGLVSIPVSLYSATQASASVSFNLLHAKCGTRLRQQYICPLDEEIVSRDQMIKGYEFAKDRYVTFTAPELKALEEKATQTIDIAEFVPLNKIDPVYFDKPYYLGPEKGGEKAYLLLAEVMKESNRAAIARYAARGKQYIVMLRAAEGAQGGTVGLVMQTLLYADEVRPFSEVPIPTTAPLREGELNLAKQLVQQIASETFNPADYQDDVRVRMLADIQRKVDGQEIANPPPVGEPAQVIDLMEALKASLGQQSKLGRAKSRSDSDPTAVTTASTPDAAHDALASRRPARRARSGSTESSASEGADPSVGTGAPPHGARRRAGKK